MLIICLSLCIVNSGCLAVVAYRNMVLARDVLKAMRDLETAFENLK